MPLVVQKNQKLLKNFILTRMVIQFLRPQFLKITNQCVIRKSNICRMMPSCFPQTPPKKKTKTSHKYLEMGKPHKGSSGVHKEHNLNMDKSENLNIKNQREDNNVQDFSNVKIDYLECPIKSENDKKEYRVIKLPNGLTALLIADPRPASCQDDDSEPDDEDNEIESESDDNEETGSEGDTDSEDEDEDEEERDGSRLMKIKKEEKMAACGLCIGVGSFSDPPEVPGMAHFLEHMVFMGSKKYPEENDFDAFIKRHGGFDNAYTECEHTIFHFEVHEKFLHSALDRFAQFFISPLMKRDAITREREAVESEFQMALPSDSHRKEQLISSLARNGHPANKFVWGNLITLRDNITEDKLYEELHKFRERHYSAHRMTVAIQARLPLDTLQKYVIECFSNVPSNGLPPSNFDEFKGVSSFDTPRFRRMYKVKAVKDNCQLDLTWTLPSLLHLYKSKPHQYVSWIIGHEGKGSLISYLRKKMWCMDIESGNAESGFEHSSMYALFSISLMLTDDGFNHIKEILDAVFSYINLVRREGPQQRFYDEIHKVEDINFRFSDETPPDEYVESLCEHMHFYSPAHYLNGNNLYFEYNPESIKSCMDALTPENTNIMILNKKFNEEEFDKTEPWFKTKYTDVDIPADWIECWKKAEPFPEFNLPEPSIFIPDDFSLIPRPEKPWEYPVKIHSDPDSEIWYKPDTKFGLPECYMNFYFVSPLPQASPENLVMMDLFTAVLKQLVNEELYPAGAAGLSYSFAIAPIGLMIKVNGFNQKLPLFLTTITKYIANFSNLVTKELFEAMKEEQTKIYNNKLFNPEKLVKDVRLAIIILTHWSSFDERTAIPGIEFEQFKYFAEHLTDHIYTRCLVQGNMTAADAIENSRKCIEMLKCRPLLSRTMPNYRVMQIPNGEQCCRVKNCNAADSNSIVMNYYQSGGISIRQSVVIELIIMIMEEPLFHQLRTKEQLGYDVFCQAWNVFGVLGYSINVCAQANKYTTEYVDERIENFLLSFKQKLDEMTESELQVIKNTLLKLKQCTDIHLREEVDKNWSEISSREYVFDRYAREISVIDGIKIEELREFMKNHTREGSNFSKLSIQIVGYDGKTPEKNTENMECDDLNLESGGKVKFPLQFLRDLPDEKNKKPSNYYITDIEEYKRNLHVFPIYKST